MKVPKLRTEDTNSIRKSSPQSRLIRTRETATSRGCTEPRREEKSIICTKLKQIQKLRERWRRLRSKTEGENRLRGSKNCYKLRTKQFNRLLRWKSLIFTRFRWSNRKENTYTSPKMKMSLSRPFSIDLYREYLTLISWRKLMRILVFSIFQFINRNF